MKSIIVLLLCLSLFSCSDQGGVTYGTATDIKLIMESELNYAMREIGYDFEKLLTASPKIPLKIFICLLGNNKKLEDLKAYFDDAVKSCKTFVEGDSIICLIGDDWGSGEFEHYKVVKK